MMNLKTAASRFLEEKRVAIVGVSRHPAETANAIYRKFKQNGYTVFPVNPAAAEVEGVKCYASVKDIPGGVGAVMMVLTPAASVKVARDCADAGVKWVWLHLAFGSSVSEDAVKLLREKGIHVIPGGCPMMFLTPDGGHKAMRWLLQLFGRLPRTV
ncbi:MAG: CoA-binding protein [Anaerolineales bacterium]